MAIFPFRKAPLRYSYIQLTLYIIILNVGIFFLGLINESVANNLLLNPIAIAFHYQFWQILTYAFMNIDPMQLVVNLLVFFFFSFEVERQMGSWGYAIFFLVTVVGTAAIALILFFAFGVPVFLYGSDGIVDALVLAFACFFPHANIYLFGLIPVRAPLLVVGVVVIQIIATFIAKASFGWGNLNPLFGLIIGYFYMLIRYRLDLVKLILNRD